MNTPRRSKPNSHPGSDEGCEDPNATTPVEASSLDERSNGAWWFVLIALASWSYLLVWTNNIDMLAFFYPLRFAGWLAIFLIPALGIKALVSRLITGDSSTEHGFALAATTLIFLQSWPTAGSSRTIVLFVAAAVVTFILVLRLVPAFPNIRGVFIALAIALIAMPLITAANVGWRSLTTSNGYVASAQPTSIDDLGAPDVLIVVLDGYSGSDALEDYFGHDNSDFERRLSTLGVEVVSGAVSNYAKTQLSIASLLEGRYPAIGEWGDLSFDEIASVHAGNNTLFASLDAVGYETHLFDNAWTFTRCGANVDVCHRSGLNELDYLVVGRTPIAEAPLFAIYPWITSSMEQLREATRLFAQARVAPRLVYVHALIPHPPLHMTPDCALRIPGMGESGGVDDTEAAREAYGDQVDCVNRLVVDLVEAAPRDAVVFITGDHGVRWTRGGEVQRSDSPWIAPVPVSRSIITALRLPSVCDTPPEHATLMRSAATLFTCLGIEYEGTPERSPTQPDRFFNQIMGRDRYYAIREVTDEFVGTGSLNAP